MAWRSGYHTVTYLLPMVGSYKKFEVFKKKILYQSSNLIVSQTSLSVSAPPKNTTTVKSQRKNPKKKKSPSETAKQMDPNFLTDPPVAPQHPTIDPITTKIKITHKIVTGAVRAY